MFQSTLQQNSFSILIHNTYIDKIKFACFVGLGKVVKAVKVVKVVNVNVIVKFTIRIVRVIKVAVIFDGFVAGFVDIVAIVVVIVVVYMIVYRIQDRLQDHLQDRLQDRLQDWNRPCRLTSRKKFLQCFANTFTVFNVSQPDLSIASANYSSLSYPSIKNSDCLECDSHMHPFLRCSMSVHFHKNRADVPLGLKQTYTSRKGKIDLIFITIRSLLDRIKQALFVKKLLFIDNWNSKIYNNLNLPTYNANVNINDMIIIGDGYWRIILLRSGNVERNLGPESMALVTLNCRGLKKESKLKQLINRIYKTHSSNENLIVALQETHLEYNNLKYVWGGSHIFTAGTGNQGGCITLLSSNIKVINQIDIGNEAHIALIEVINRNTTNQIILTNIHAPCAHNSKKIDYFKSVREGIDNIQLGNDLDVIILGDFNTAMCNKDRINTIYSNSEKKIANQIFTMFDDLQITDCWVNGKTDMTWRHGDKMSKIDRIWWSPGVTKANFITKTDWTYTDSDHAAVIVTFKTESTNRKERVTRLDTRFMSNVQLKHKFMCEVKNRYDQLESTNMNPHQKLEYLKMTIRSVALEIAAGEKKESDRRQQELKENINFWQKAFENSKSDEYKSLAIAELNTLIAERDSFLETRGEYLSRRVKTKWYHESEKSSKYFLNIQRAKSRVTQMNSLLINGDEITETYKINNEVETFYKSLYEKGDSKLGN